MKRLLFIITTCLGFNLFGQTDSLDILSDKGLLINNKIPSYTIVQQLINNFNKPDSIIIKTLQCGGYFEAENVAIYYYGETTFETHGDTAVLRTINFSDEKFKIYTPKIILSKNTTFTEFKKIFPFSANNSDDWVDPTNNKTYKLVRMKPCYQCDSRWILKFHNGKLVDIDYWIDC